jgi:hypothetical protein
VTTTDSQLGRRYKDFYSLSAYLVANKDWTASNMEDLLEDFVYLVSNTAIFHCWTYHILNAMSAVAQEEKYKQQLKTKNAMMSRAWQSLKMKIINQVSTTNALILNFLP